MNADYIIALLTALTDQTQAILGCTREEALITVCDTHATSVGLNPISDSGVDRDFELPSGDIITCYFTTPNQSVWLEEGEFGFEHTYMAKLA